MATPTQVRYRFGEVELDVARRVLLRRGERVDLEPRTFDVLHHLLVHRDRVVPKEELLDEVWGDRFVGDSALSTRIKHARAAVDDDGRTQRVIRTVHRVGYCFVAEVSEDASGDAALGTARPLTEPQESDTAGLLGRDDEADTVARRLAEHPVVTITGPAGVGKTALAAAVGSRHRELGPVVACELSHARRDGDVAEAVLAAIGAARQGGADPTESALRALEHRSGLMVLDNCEHLLAAVGSFVAQLRHRAPDLRVLATSREPLGLAAESVVVLDPLAPDDAAALFVRRALDAGASGVADDEPVRRLCDRLDRLPLAIELAASRTRVLTVAQLLDLLDDRFRLLRSSGPGPQRSLHAAIAASWDSLTTLDAELLAGLAVFSAPFTIDDAHHVALPAADPLDVVDALDRLVRHSVLVVRPGDGVRSRFALLESVRDFATAVSPSTRERRLAHVTYFVQRAEELDAACQTPALDGALAEFADCWVDLRAAVRTALELEVPEAAARIVRAAAAYAELFAVYELGDWSEELVGAWGTEPGDPLYADVLAVHARMLAHQGRLDPAGELAPRAVAAHVSHVTVLGVVWSAYYTGDLDTVLAEAPRLVELSRSDRGVDRAYAEGFAALVAAVRQDDASSTAPVDLARAEHGALGAFDTLAAGLRRCGSDPDTAADLLEAVVDVSLRRDYHLLLGAAASTLTQVALPARPAREARATLARTLSRYAERNMWNLIVADIVMAAKLLTDAGELDTAARLLGARRSSGYSVGLSEVLVPAVEAELGERLGGRLDELVAEGRRWRPTEAARVAIERLHAARR